MADYIAGVVIGVVVTLFVLLVTVPEWLPLLVTHYDGVLPC